MPCDCVLSDQNPSDLIMQVNFMLQAWCLPTQHYQNVWLGLGIFFKLYRLLNNVLLLQSAVFLSFGELWGKT